jgi:hypothetical protein
MKERALAFIEDIREIVEDQSLYLKDKDWSFLAGRKARIDEHNLQVGILKSFLDRISLIMLECGEEFHSLERIKKFCLKMSIPIKNHIERSYRYFNFERWTQYDEDREDEKPIELKFQEDVLKQVIALREKLKELNLEQETDKDVKIPIHGTSLIPISMRNLIEERYKEVREFLSTRKSKQKDTNNI